MLQATAATSKLDEAKEAILNRCLLYDKDTGVLYIKWNDELKPIGGTSKQRFLKAGDNIEIIDGTDESTASTVRLLDDIDINTMTLSPDPDEIPNWKGTTKLGILESGNIVFLLMKETDLASADRSILGGEVLIKMTRTITTDSDSDGTADGTSTIETYAQYAITCTSTGSWSLQGACQDTAEVRMVRAKWNDEYYYGLKLPATTLSYTKGSYKTRTVTKSKTEVVSSTTTDQVSQMFLQVGQAEDSSGNILSCGTNYSQTLANVVSGTPRDEGTTRLFIGRAGITTVQITNLGSTGNDLEYWYSVPAANIAANIETSADSWTHGDLWNNLIDNGYAFNFRIYTKYIEHNTSDTDAISQGVEDLSGNSGTITLGDVASSTCYAKRSGKATSFVLSGSGGSVTCTVAQTWGNSSNYTIQAVKLSALQSALGITFQNSSSLSLKTYTDAGYYFVFSMYGDSTAIRFGAYAITTVLPNSSNLPMSGTSSSAFTNAIKSSSITAFYGGTDDSAFFVRNSNIYTTSSSSKTTDYYYGYYTFTFGTFYNNATTTTVPVVDSLSDRVKIHITEITLTPYTPTVATVESASICTWIASSDGTVSCSNDTYKKTLTWYDDNYWDNASASEDRDTTSSKWSLVSQAYAYLRFGTEVSATNPHGSWSALADTLDDFTTYTTETTTWEEEETYWDESGDTITTSSIQNAAFWFNGWNNVANMPSGYTDENITYQILSDKSNDNDSYAGTYMYSTIEAYMSTTSGISSLAETGEDNAPYKIIITQQYLSLSDLQNIAECVRHLERQISLDLSQCTVKSDAQVWTTAIFESCSSLRELKIPQGVTQLGPGIFKWCTYMRELDLTPSAGTLTYIGSSNWEQNTGLLVSTRVTNLIIPMSVSTLGKYLVYASNIKNMILLHDSTVGFCEANVSASTPYLRAEEWCWNGNEGGTLTYDLPDGFHLFVSEEFWNDGTSLGNNKGQANSNGTGWDWYPTSETSTRWGKQIIDSIVTYPQDGTQEEWQTFNDTYKWGEDLINKVRSYFGHTDTLEIVE